MVVTDSAVFVKQIEAEAFRLGFCLLGVTPPDSLENEAIFERWLTQRLNGGMKYLESERHRTWRQDPSLLLPGVKSILVLGWPYTLTRPSEEFSGGLIAGYALHQDYHEKLLPQMTSLVEFIREKSGGEFEYKLFTDSAPLLERELGQRAGLGWIGKNSCLISPKVGSSFLLSEILLSLELPASEAFATERCGACHRCIDACPTHCIRSDRTIDAGKCISFLTIENKGNIPLEYREAAGHWVFGCDICQSVCPWNEKAGQKKQGCETHPLPSTDEMLQSLLLTPEGFKTRFAQSPVLRARRKGYLRNLAVALANLKEKRAAPLLTDLLKSETDEDLQNIFQWALEKLSS